MLKLPPLPDDTAEALAEADRRVGVLLKAAETDSSANTAYLLDAATQQAATARRSYNTAVCIQRPAGLDQTTPLDRRIRHDEAVRRNVLIMWNAEPRISTLVMARKINVPHSTFLKLAHSMGLSRPSPIKPGPKPPVSPHRSPITITPPSEWAATNRHVPTLAEALRDSETLRALA